MNKKMSLRVLAGFLAFVMVFFSVTDYTVFAANTDDTESAIAEFGELDTEVDAEDATDAEDDAATVADFNEDADADTVSANKTTDKNKDVVISDDEVNTVKDSEQYLKMRSLGNGKYVWEYNMDNLGDIVVFAELENGTLTFKKMTKNALSIVPESFLTNVDTNTVSTMDIANIKSSLLKKIEFESGCDITRIDTKAFRDCTALTSVDFSKCPNFTDVRGQAFSGCTSLTDVVLGETISMIGEKAFEMCISLKEIELTSKLTDIYPEAFTKCSSLHKVKVNTGNVKGINNNRNLKIFAGCAIDEIDTSDIEGNIWPQYLFSGATFADDFELVIPAKFKSIGEAAFLSAENITSVKFESGTAMTSFEQGAFAACKSMASIEIPSTLTNIKWQAFDGCTALKEIDLSGADIVEIGKWAFRACSRLETVKLPKKGSIQKHYTENSDGSLSLMEEENSKEAFMQCSNLTTVENIGSLVYISIGEFKYCKSLQNVDFSRCTEVDKEAFFGSGLTSADLSTVRVIGEAAFKECENLKSVNLSNLITVIPKETFYKCHSLNLINKTGDKGRVIPNSVVEIGEKAFGECTSLGTDIILSENLQKIGKLAFGAEIDTDSSGSSISMKLTNITIPENVIWIGEGAFMNNLQLSRVVIKSKKIGFDKNLQCGRFIFRNCSISDVTLPQDITEIPDLLFCGASFNTGYTFVIPSTVKRIGKWAFAADRIDNAMNGTKNGLMNIESFQFPDTQLEVIDEYAFAGNAAVTAFTIPSTVTYIGTGAFCWCTKITSIIIPENITYIGNYTFTLCQSLENIYYNAINVVIPNDGELTGVFQGCVIKDVVIGKLVETIPAGIFKDASFYKGASGEELILISLTIPEKTTEIKKNAFANCKNLGSIEYASQTNVTRIQSGAFSGCENLTKIMVPDSVTQIDARAFKDCVKLEDFHMPKNLTVLGGSAFENCKSLKAITIPEGVEVIEAATFKDCTAATSITFEGNRVQKILDNAFSGCSNVVGVLEIPYGVKQIASGAFENCTGYTELQLPTSLTNISPAAFVGCNFRRFYAVKDSVGYKWLVDQGFISGESDSKFEALYNIEYVGLLDTDFNPNACEYRAGQVVTFTAPEREGYQFIGFYTDEAFTNEIKSTSGLNGDLKIFLKWQGTEFVVNYDIDTATNNAKNPKIVEYGKDLVLYQPVRRGYKFNGWVLVTVDNNGKEVEKGLNKKNIDGEEVYVVPAVKDEITVRAKFTELNYRIVFELNTPEAKFRKAYESKKTINAKGEETVYLLPEDCASRSGWVLLGWNTQADGQGEHFDCGAKVTGLTDKNEIKLYGEWEKGCYYIKYNVGKDAKIGESTGMATYAASLIRNKKLLTDEYVTRNGYKLIGWSTKKNGKGDQFLAGDEVAPLKPEGKKITLYAVYEKIPYTISYVLPEGAVNPNYKTSYDVTKNVSLKKPTLDGYVFAGWYTSNEPKFAGKLAKIKKGTYGDLTLYARFQYKIAYNANGGKVSTTGKALLTKSGTGDYAINVTLAAPSNTEIYKDGMVFAGWNTRKDGMGTKFEAGKEYAVKDIVNACGGKKIKLYAMWQ